jgi:hypothetical protein
MIENLTFSSKRFLTKAFTKERINSLCIKVTYFELLALKTSFYLIVSLNVNVNK